MPSIDLVRLRAEARDLAGSLPDPTEFQMRMRALMESYAHRLLRRGRSMAQRSALPAWEVSGILLRELDSALRPAASENPDAAVSCADAIWKNGRLEERILAAHLLGYSFLADAIRQRLAEWLWEMDDPMVLEELADYACHPLRNGPPEIFRADIRGWIESRRRGMRWFGWMALDIWLRAGADEALLTALDLLLEALPESNADILRSAASVLIRTATAAPAEARKWLNDIPTAAVLMGRTFFETALPKLPAELAQEVRIRMAH
jgi:hypothetical protein